MRKNFCILFVISIFICNKSYAQLEKTKILDSLFELLQDNNQAMGSFMISKNDSIIYGKVFGYRFYSESEKLLSDKNTKYRIGSVSKLFTATLIFQLVEEGKINLSSTLDKYFPELPRCKIVTVGNLLNHRSGYKNFRIFKENDHIKTRKELLQRLGNSRMEFEPGTKTGYSNSNYVLLSFLIESVCGMPYATVLKEKILSKIGLNHTMAGHPTNLEHNESYSYKFRKEWQQQSQTDLSLITGTGGIISTPADLIKFITSLFSYKLVNENSLGIMKTITDGFGMGIVPFPFYEKTGYGHYGEIDNFASVVAYFPEDSIAVAYCTNAEVYPVRDILVTAMSIYFGKDYAFPVFAIFIPHIRLDKNFTQFSFIHSYKYPQKNRAGELCYHHLFALL